MHLSDVILRKSEILALAEKHGARDVRVFGSVARGTATDDSDLDLLVALAPVRTPFFPGGLKADLEDLLGCSIDIVTEQSLHRLMRAQILAECRSI